MTITWLAHASFLIEGEGIRLITDPYEPNDIINLPPVTEPADIVVRSSDDDEAHCYVETIPPGFELITATDIVENGARAKGISFSAVWSQESMGKDVVRDNAMYRFTLEGIEIAHMGDIGNPLSSAQMDFLRGADVLLALTGGFPTIDLDELEKVISGIAPRIVIPMHYRIPGPRFAMLPVTDFTDRYPASMIDRVGTDSLELSPDGLPGSTRIMVMEPRLYRNN